MLAFNPFTASVPPEVPLPEAPLVRVVAQVRFPAILSLAEPSRVARFQEIVRGPYPALVREDIQSVEVGSSGMLRVDPSPVYRLSDAASEWRVSLAPSFLALETTAYGSRADFLRRFEVVLEALDTSIQPGVVQRFGMRYIDRIPSRDRRGGAALFREPLASMWSAFDPEAAPAVISQVHFRSGVRQILARFGMLPESATIDPAVLEPISEPSWVLDLDMSRSDERKFDRAEILADAGEFARRIYSVFRFMVTDEFLRRFGGKP